MNKNNSLFVPVLALFLFNGLSVQAEEKRILLKSDALTFADGKSYGIGSNDIGLTIKTFNILRDMLDGHKNPKGIRIGLFTLDGNLYTVKELLKMENDLDLELAKFGNSAALTKKKTALNNALKQAIQHIEVNVLPALQQVSGVRTLIISLITQSCEKRQRPNSLLLDWGRCVAGTEAETMRKQLASFKLLTSFITDLQDFLQDFVHSCPKAYAQFMATFKQNTHKDAPNLS